ncbi:SGNH/GDSL hydrolase family protein [Hydrogenophaga sp. 5NK40-0174]|uniref:SGNH/GDSL hydrolase family protein n=1 Tax=Hydrogenophaga sp. 5NK40-0174 TaxID=3127649 RepID=UPI00310428A9
MRFTQICPTRLTSVAIAAAMVSVLAGCSSSSKKSDDDNYKSVIPSPFRIEEGKGTKMQINTLRTFGDSYTDINFTTNSRRTSNWTTELSKDVPSKNIYNFAIGGARAANLNHKSFYNQINNMVAQGRHNIADGDLTVVYLGHNDINLEGSTNNLSTSRQHYSREVGTLINLGAANTNRRLFLTQLSDWSRGPAVNPGTRGQVLFWNQYIAALANSRENVIAVDMFTPFERIFNNPGEYGFTNVTTADQYRSMDDTLFHDDRHYGTRGQQIIARVYAHYLTRGWDWANTLAAGAETANQLNKDIDAGTLTLFNGKSKSVNGSWNLIALGEPGKAQHQPITSVKATATNLNDRNLPRADFGKSQSPYGLALDFSAGGAGSHARNARYGFAFSQADTNRKVAGHEERNLNKLSGNASTFYWHQPAAAGFLVSTQLSRHDLDYSNSASDDILSRTVSNSGEGKIWSFETKLRRPMSNSQMMFTPWVSLSSMRQSMSAYDAQTLYTVDTRYQMNALTDTYAGIGFDVQSHPMLVGRGMELTLGGGLSHITSLSRSDARVSMTELSRNFTQSETIERDQVQRTRLGFNADLSVSRNFSVSATYATHLQDVKGTQAVQISANYSF